MSALTNFFLSHFRIPRSFLIVFRSHKLNLSSNECEELTGHIGDIDLKAIVAEVTIRFLLRLTHSHNSIDQLSRCVRYVSKSMPVERFPTFMMNTGHTCIGPTGDDDIAHTGNKRVWGTIV